ncbi:hypothetical protein CK203_084514 [Vitis vinifera]|uniref:Uncharacterized protein n=1 Tax=Vitis vinifera TaxID=29760 RepID=A0A438EGA2_VITVI|nr:hypothetical protein CK203_084514 [Vitis vinifera]
MDTEEKISNNQEGVDDSEETEAVELILFQVSECYVYLIPQGKVQLPTGFHSTVLLKLDILISIDLIFLRHS